MLLFFNDYDSLFSRMTTIYDNTTKRFIFYLKFEAHKFVVFWFFFLVFLIFIRYGPEQHITRDSNYIIQFTLLQGYGNRQTMNLDIGNYQPKLREFMEYN